MFLNLIAGLDSFLFAWAVIENVVGPLYMSRERETVLVKSKIDDLAENKKVVLANRTDIDVNIHLSQPEPDSNIN